MILDTIVRSVRRSLPADIRRRPMEQVQRDAAAAVDRRSFSAALTAPGLQVIAEFKKATQDFKENLQVDNDLKEARDTIREVKEDLEDTVRKSMTESTAGKETDAVSEDEPEQHTFEKDVTGGSEGSVEDKPRQEAGSKEPVKNA